MSQVMNRYKTTDAAIHCGSRECDHKSGEKVHWQTCAGCTDHNVEKNDGKHACQGMSLTNTGKLWVCRCECLIKWNLAKRKKVTR